MSRALRVAAACAALAAVHGMPGHSGSFTPLPCNADVGMAACTPWSARGFDLSATVVVPCGECVVVDVAGEVVLQGGLNVEGRLVFPAGRAALTVTTPYIIVQGELVVEELADATIPSPAGAELKVRLVGTDGVTLTTHPLQAYGKCAAGCSVGKKPIAVAGGRLHINAAPEGCATWSRLQAAEALPAPTRAAPAVPAAPAGCAAALVDASFDGMTGAVAGWDGMGSGVVGAQDGFYRVFGRPSDVYGPRVQVPVGCVVAGADYTVRFQYRYEAGAGASGALIEPYVKLLRKDAATGGTDWTQPAAVFPRGSMAAVEAGVWYSVERTVSFTAAMADPTATSKLELYLAPFSDKAVGIDVDNVQVVLAAVDAAATCDGLLSNADAASAAGAAYPFHATGGALVAMTDGADGSFFRSTLRTSIYSSVLSHRLPTECLAPHIVYEFSALVRADVATAVSGSVWLEPADGAERRYVSTGVCDVVGGAAFARCSGFVTFTAAQLEGGVAAATLHLSSSEVGAVVDWTDVTLQHRGGRTQRLTVEAPSTTGCWGAGAEVLVTSHTVEHTDTQVAVVAEVSTDGDLILTTPVALPTTMDDDEDAAVEVALLTRNVVVEAVEDDAEALHGGHVIVMHTGHPVTQRVVGVELRKMGQQGNLGRYPLHMHMCASAMGSVLAKNSVRDSKQRGIVIHGTNDVLVAENVMHNTRGHGFLLEDGAETGNVVHRNLGAVSHGVTTLISPAESDNAPATFWLTNPDNTFTENVAAGSAFSGFWFEVAARVRGPSAALHPDMVPNQLPLRKFDGNVAHSNNNHGLQTYPQTGYRPAAQAYFRNVMSYRNRGSGVFFHAGGRLAIDGGYLADNKLAVDVDADHSDLIRNVRIVGRSPAYRALQARLGAAAYLHPRRALCSGGAVHGVRLDSFHSGTLFGATGTTVADVIFEGFEPAADCANPAALHVDYYAVGLFDPRNTLKEVTLDDGDVAVDLCTAEPQVAIRHASSSFFGTPGSIIADTAAIRAHASCVPAAGLRCALFCPGVCLRTLAVRVPSSYEASGLTLEVSGTAADGTAITPVVIGDYVVKPLEFPASDSAHRTFYATLPSGGAYTARFVLHGATVWPTYTDLSYEDRLGGACGADFASFDIERPAAACADLVQNGRVDAGDAHWRHIGHFGLAVGVENGNSFLTAPNPAGSGGAWVGPAQYLDTRCIAEGVEYGVSARIRLTENGAPYACTDDCPTATLRFRNLLGGPENTWVHLGTYQQADGAAWNAFFSRFTASAHAAAAHTAFLYINGARAGVDISIDDLSVAEYVPTPAPTVAGVFDITEGCVTPVGGNGFILETATGADAAVLSNAAYSGAPGTGDFDFVVKMLDRDVSASGYQPNLVPFFAPAGTALTDVVTNDNGWGQFEAAVLAWTRERIYCCIDHTWLTLKVDVAEDGAMATGSGGHRAKLTALALKLSRVGGAVRAALSVDGGATWSEFGGSHMLPAAYQTAPLKVGYRVKRSWKSAYRIVTEFEMPTP
eukprot:TRINITY_DN9171_c0_g1_i1.p1 TRINITY_DN9171_c0_g1~~TRINITY_DN9171_c0_g1_i1.p1  ORF type:complete len:1511 (+),score=550.46 TRINITY_DN9171_c0_g1_i1:43-4575(+)